jgi:zinc protease
VTEERRMRTEDQPREKMSEQFRAVAFTSSPYKNPVIGWANDIAAYQVKDLQAWYQQWYAPNNATLVVVGDVNPYRTFAMAEEYFGDLEPSEITPVKPQHEMEQQGIKRITVKAPAKLPYVMMGYKVPVLRTSLSENDAYALEVLAGVLDGGNSARLSRRLIRGQQIASSVDAGYNLTSRLDDLFVVEATPAAGKTVQALEQALKAEIKQLQTERVSEEELKRVKAQVLANNIYERDSNFYQAMLLGMFETVGLGWQKYADYVNKVNAITAEQVRDVARQYLIEDHLTVAYLDPQPMTESSHQSNSLVGGRHAH